ncbi:MAG: M48 family metalloprotease [bacterium]|nr:M48 family metalloprotease [bacterium]
MSCAISPSPHGLDKGEFLSTQGEFDCPDCGKQNPIEKPFQNWCENCGWGVVQAVSDKDANLLEKIYLKLGKRQGAKLFDTLVSRMPEQLKPSWSFSYLLTLALSSTVHLLTGAMIVLGFYLITLEWPNFLLILLGCTAFGLVWLLRPRVPRVPDNRVSPKDFPVFFRVINEMNEKLGGRPIDYLVINEEFNASFSFAGWSRHPVLTIGLPLWNVLDHEERLAVIAHELSHGVNGDAERGGGLDLPSMR